MIIHSQAFKEFLVSGREIAGINPSYLVDTALALEVIPPTFCIVAARVGNVIISE